MELELELDAVDVVGADLDGTVNAGGSLGKSERVPYRGVENRVKLRSKREVSTNGVNQGDRVGRNDEELFWGTQRRAGPRVNRGTSPAKPMVRLPRGSIGWFVPEIVPGVPKRMHRVAATQPQSSSPMHSVE